MWDVAVGIVIAALILAWSKRPKKQLYFCRFIKKVHVCEAERKRKYPPLSNGVDLHRDGLTIDFWQKVYLPFPPQLGMSVGTIAYALKKDKHGKYIPVGFDPEKPQDHAVSFDSGKIESMCWSRYDGGYSSDVGVFICEVAPYQMAEDEAVGSVTLDLVAKGWRVSSSNIEDDAAKIVRVWKADIERREEKGEEVSPSWKDDVARQEVMLDLASNPWSLINWGTLY